jgi:hypothetical protein
MDISNDSFIQTNPGLQTPGTKKRMRSENENSIENQTCNVHTGHSSMKINNTDNINFQQLSSIQRNEFPPITINFKTSNNKTDRKLIEELIKEWRIKNNKEINIIGRFGYKNVLLVFARDTQTFDAMLDQRQWPNKIDDSDFSVKYPKILPETYSSVILDFQLTWKEEETLQDIQEKYSTLIKLSRFVARDGRLLNISRADFKSSETVKQLLNAGEIDINSMKLRVRPYFSPIKINKCRKCFKHNHLTSQCASQQLCFRCGQQHAFEGGCNNEIKCVNCQQHHYSGHSSCPVVQQKRKQIAEQHKLHHAQMLIKQQQYSYKHGSSLFPSLLSQSNNLQPSTQHNSTNTFYQQKDHQMYASAVTTKPSNKQENIEQLVMAMTESINYQLSNFSVTITSQISELTKKINEYNDRVQIIEQQIDKAIIPAINHIPLPQFIHHQQRNYHSKTSPTSLRTPSTIL